VLLKIKLALKKIPIGRIDCRNISLDIWMSLAPSNRWVVRCNTRVPIAYMGVSAKRPNTQKFTYSEGKMECDEKDRIAELEGAVHMIVV